jgi:hypothetical protein
VYSRARRRQPDREAHEEWCPVQTGVVFFLVVDPVLAGFRLIDSLHLDGLLLVDLFHPVDSSVDNHLHAEFHLHALRFSDTLCALRTCYTSLTTFAPIVQHVGPSYATCRPSTLLPTAAVLVGCSGRIARRQPRIESVALGVLNSAGGVVSAT